MSDKHEAKQKALRAKAHIGVAEHHAEHQDHSHLHDAETEQDAKDGDASVQAEASETQVEASHAQQG